MRLLNSLPAALGAVVGISSLSGCFNPDPVSVDEGTDTDDPTTGVGTSAPTTTDPTDNTGTTAPSTSTDPTIDPDTSGTNDECASNGALDDACPQDTPYCSSGTCVACDAIECADIDADTPACNGSTGLCVQCADDQLDACLGTQAACIDNECVPCTEDDQCPSAVCLSDVGECLLEEVTLTGVAYDFSLIEHTPVSDVTVRLTNVTDAPTAEPTGADGVYSLAGLVPGTLLDLELGYEQDDPVFVPAVLSSRMSYQVPNDEPATLDVPLVTYNWMAKVAFECGLFATLEEAIGTVTVNPFFIQRSTLFGRLVDEEGNGIATVSKAAIHAQVGEWANFQDNLLDLNTSPTQLCFLEEDSESGTYVGSNDTVSNDTGRFVMFRLRNDEDLELGDGPLNVTASGFDDAYTTFASSGNIGVIDLVRNDEPIPRDFAIDVYPVFSTYGCIACHTGGGPAPAVHDGFAADWSLTPREVWQNMVGPGIDCSADPADPHRVCIDDPPNSLFVTRPVSDLVDEVDVHPVDIFTSFDDPTLQVIMEWIEQGALPPAEIRFEEDIYPLFQKHACVACHTAGGPDGAQSMGFDADWSLSPFEVWENLTGPGIVCPDPDNPVRICTDDPLNSKFVTYPLTDDPDMPDSHPVNAFPTAEHPDMQLIIQWIAQGALFENTCEHPVCTTGVALIPGCSDCVAEVCAEDPFCCASSWDNACVTRANDNPNCGC